MPRPFENISAGSDGSRERSFESLIHTDPSDRIKEIETGVVRPFPIKQVRKASGKSEERIARALTLLRSGKRSERLCAARELGDIALTEQRRIPESIVPLTVTLTTDGEASVREEAAWALWKLGDPRSHKALMSAILDDKSPAVREKCARVLGLMGVRAAVPVMLDLLSLERHVPARLRAGIACAFGYLAQEALLDHLIKLTKDAEPRVRYEAVRSLGRYLVGFSNEITIRVFKLLKRNVRTGYEPCGLIRKAAIKALRFSASGAATAAVVKAITSDPDAETRQTAAEALLVWDSPASEKALISALTDDCWHVRKAAARSLAKFILRYRVYNSAAVCEALRRLERMLPSHSLEWRLAADAFASL